MTYIKDVATVHRNTREGNWNIALNLTIPLTPTVAIWVQLKHPVPDRVKPSFVIFDIRAL